MVRDGAFLADSTRSRVVPGYLDRRTALELAILDALVFAAGVLLVAPVALAADAPGLLALGLMAPSLAACVRSLVLALKVPGVWSLAQLDPACEPGAQDDLLAARSATAAGFGLLLFGVLGVGFATMV